MLVLASADTACMGPIEPPCVLCIDVTALDVEDATVAVGDTVLLRAEPVFEGGLFLFYPSTVDARWLLSDPAVARLVGVSRPPPDSSQVGAVRVIGLRPGVVRVTAQLGKATGTADVHVVPPG